MLSMKRRAFLKLATATAAVAALGPRLAGAKIQYPEFPQGKSIVPPDKVKDVKLVRSMCYQCHGRCGLQAKIVGDEVVKLDGNPYDPNTYDYTSPNVPVKEEDLDAGPGGADLGSLCVKGLAGIYTLYNPRRLQHPIKRVGPRGSRKWKRISWEDAYNEIVNGGNLFGEGHVDGLKALMSDEPIGPADSKYMDEAPPTGWGPKRNFFHWSGGRNQNKPMTDRFGRAYGTINYIKDHYTICETTRNETLGEMGINYTIDFKDATYIILAGSNVYDAEFPMQTKVRYFSKWFARRAGTKAVYLGPRQGKVCASGAEWVPIKTGTDVGFFMGMLKYIIENKLYNADFLSRPSEVAAKAGKYPTYTDFTYLVKKKEPREYLKDANGNPQVSVGGTLKAAKDVTGTADLEVSTPEADTVFKLIKERVTQYTYDQYNDFCGIPRGTIERIAKEFTSAEKPVVDMYKGVSQHSNGFYSVNVIGILNIIMNRCNQVGGFTSGGGNWKGDVPKGAKEPEAKGVNVCCSRAGNYAGSKPSATRPWYPLAPGKGEEGIWQVAYANMAIGYPYPVKALLMYKGNPVLSNPRGPINAPEALKRIPLVISIDLFMNEASMLSDYVLPEGSYLEQFGIYSSTAATKSKRIAFRRPVIGKIEVGKEYRGLYPDVKTVDQIHIDLALKLGLPNFGKNADGKGNDIFTDTEYWNIYFNNKDFKGGLDPNTAHMKMGGIFSTKRSDSAVTALDKPKAAHAYIEEAATIKNAFNGKYWDALPKLVWHIDSNWDEVKPNPDYPYLLGTHKDAHHTQSRTAENLWLMSLEPENGLEINPADAEKLGVRTGDFVAIEAPSGEYTLKCKVILTETMKPGIVEIKNSYGHWELGSRDIEIQGGISIKGDPRVGAGWHYAWVCSPDPAIKGDSRTITVPTEPVFGSAEQYGHPVKIRKV